MDAEKPVGQETGVVRVIGVGPGDPELLTLRALRALRGSHLIVHPGPSNRSGFAYEIVAGQIEPWQTVEGASLRMKRGQDDGSVGYGRIARRLADAALGGLDVAYLTEGDPMLFGSGSYVVESLKTIEPGVSVEVIPGVSAMSAAAARLGWPLAQKESVFTVCPATYHPDDLGAILDRPGTSCWLKAADVLPRLVEELRSRGRLERAALIEKVGRTDERIFHDLTEALKVDLSYFSIVLAR